MKNLLIVLFVLTGCATAVPVAKTGTVKYRISDVTKLNGVSVVKIYGFPDDTFVLNSDTLKVDDIITITWIKRRR